ncbi:MAG: ABC transporter permease [Bacteroidales bacterium]|nr:ABC transporter permease [Bacteroidales bacterium]
MINIIGLAIGMGASLLITLWVFDELSYDKYNEKIDNIYRVDRDIFFNKERFLVPVTGAIYGATIKSDFPEFEDMVRVYPNQVSIEDNRGVDHNERVFFVDPSFFNVFTFPFKQGDPIKSLEEPFTAVLTEKGVEKYFGDQDPVNKHIQIEWGEEKKSYLVTAIIENVPENSHFHFDVLTSFCTLETYMPDNLKTWLNNYLYTYVLLKDGIKKEQAEEKLQVMVDKHIIPAYEKFMKKDDVEGSMKLYLEPLSEIHLTDIMWGIEPSGSKSSVYTFSIVAILILVIACFNFMNLSTALAGRRSLEVGVRKTMGANKRQLIFQFLGESFVMALISFIIALLIIEIILPYYNTFTNKSLTLLTLGKPEILIALLIIIFGTGIIAGIYPAFYLSSFRPIIVLKGKMDAKNKKFNFRQILVVLQFGISIALIIGTITAYLQMNFFQNKSLGFQKENIMIIPLESNYVRNHYDVFRDELIQHPIIEKVAASSKVPATSNYSDTGFETELLPDETFLSRFYSVDYDYFDTYEMEIIAGRNFSKEYAKDTTDKWILNESALNKLGVSDPNEAIGKKYTVHRGSEDDYVEGKIIGIVKDYHYQGLDKKIEPMSHFIGTTRIKYISVRYNEGKEKETIEIVENLWKKHFSGVQFSSLFLTERYNNLYQNEQKLQTTIIAFTILAVFVACLGLFGLAAFVAQMKTKEIGIRKVHGASIFSIIKLLDTNFAKLVIIANIIAWPIAYFFLDEWLTGFYYRIDMPYWVFIISGLLGLMIAMLTVSYQAIMAARTNPVNALRFE